MPKKRVYGPENKPVFGPVRKSKILNKSKIHRQKVVANGATKTGIKFKVAAGAHAAKHKIVYKGKRNGYFYVTNSGKKVYLRQDQVHTASAGDRSPVY